MKNFITLLAFILISTVHAGTCTSISRTNSASLSVLTSTKYNTDLNTVYTAANALDGGCITDGTLEDGALNTTDFAALLKGLTQGCKVIYSNASTVQIDKCLASVNGNFVSTTSTTNASFGCAGCSSETASTAYYVYIQTGSSGSTLTPLILTTAPNNDGYDNSGNKVLARFYNSSASDIDQYSIDQWHINRFVPTNTTWASVTPVWSGFGTVTSSVGKWRRIGDSMEYKFAAVTGVVPASIASVTLPNSLSVDSAKTMYNNTTSTVGDVVGLTAHAQAAPNSQSNVLLAPGTDPTKVYFGPQHSGSGDKAIAVNGSSLTTNSTQYQGYAKMPIAGWSN